MHGEIKRTQVYGSYGQPNFKHWWKFVTSDGFVIDYYFEDDTPQIVVSGGRYFIIDPTRRDSIKFDGGEIYHVISSNRVA